MKRDNDADERFEWDMAAITMLVLLIMFVLVALLAIGPLGHTT